MLVQRQHTPPCPYPGSDRPCSGAYRQTPINSFTLHKRPSAVNFTSCLLLQLYSRLFQTVPSGDSVHAAAFGARVPPAEHAAGGLGGLGASRVEGRYLDISQSREIGQWCLKAFVFKSALPSPNLHVGYIQL